MKKLILEVFMALILSVMGFSTAKADPININKENEAINKQSEPDITAQQINQYNQNVSNTIQINEVTFDSYVHSGKTAVVYVGFAECPHYEKFVSILHKFIEDTGVPVYYLNLDNLGQINSDFINDMQRFKINSTPTVFLLKHGKIIHHYVGDNITENELITLTKYHY